MPSEEESYEKSVWLILLVESCQCCSHLRLVFEVSWFTTTCPFLHATCGREDKKSQLISLSMSQLRSLSQFTASNIYSTYLQIIESPRLFVTSSHSSHLSSLSLWPNIFLPQLSSFPTWPMTFVTWLEKKDLGQKFCPKRHDGTRRNISSQLL